MKHLTRSAAALLLAVSCAAPLARAEEQPETAPATKAVVKPAAPNNDPTVGSIKDPGFVKRHEGFLKDKEQLLKKGPIQFVLLGDSITDGWRGGGKAVFQTAFGQYNPYNTGIGGDRTQHVIWRIENGELDGLEPNPKVAMVMIGTNNLGSAPDEAIAAGIKKVVEDIHEKLPKTKVLLLGVFPRGAKADNGARAKIKTINDIISKLDDGGKTVKYLDIGDKFLDAQGNLPKEIMPDALHPNAKGYEIWAEAVKPSIEELMKD